MANDYFEPVQPGDPIRADDIQGMRDAIENLGRMVVPSESHGYTGPGFSGMRPVVPPAQMLVRIEADVLIDASLEYTGGIFTGVPQIWDPTQLAFIDVITATPDANSIVVTTYGNVPLKTGDLLTVYYDPGHNKWLPTSQILTDVVRVSSTTANANGYFPAFVQIFDINSQATSDGLAVQVVYPNGDAAATQMYHGRLVSHVGGLCVYAVFGGGSPASQIAFVAPNDPPTLGNAISGAVIKTFNTTFNTWSDGALCYLMEADWATGSVTGNNQRFLTLNRRYMASLVGNYTVNQVTRPLYVTRDFLPYRGASVSYKPDQNIAYTPFFPSEIYLPNPPDWDTDGFVQGTGLPRLFVLPRATVGRNLSGGYRVRFSCQAFYKMTGFTQETVMGYIFMGGPGQFDYPGNQFFTISSAIDALGKEDNVQFSVDVPLSAGSVDGVVLPDGITIGVRNQISTATLTLRNIYWSIESLFINAANT
jgi:hypothetical protein